MYYATLILKTLPVLSKVLARSRVHALYLYSTLIFFLLIKKIRKDTRAWEFNFYFNNTNFVLKLFEGSTDIAALKEIFIDGEYAWDVIKDPKVIVDLGAHTGNTAIYFHVLYPDAKIYAVEASPRTFSFLKENVSHISQIVPIHCAVSNQDGHMSFYESESSLGSSVHERNNSLAVEVPARTLSSLFRENEIERADFMKIDIEGAEELLFESVKPGSLAQFLIVEIHDDLMQNTREEFLANFEGCTLRFQSTTNSQRILLRAVAGV